MFKMKASVLVALVLGVATAPLRADELERARESKAWHILLKMSGKDTTTNMPEFLDRFLQTYPKGEHAADARFALAETYFNKGRYDLAFPYYKDLIEDKDSAYVTDARLREGEMFYNRKDIANAKKVWRKLLDKAPARSLLSAEALYGLALCEMHEQNYLEALHILDRLTHKHRAYANLPKIQELTGIMRFKEKNYREAIAALQGVSTPVAAFYRGLSHFYQKQYQEAAQAFHGMADMPSGPYAEMGAYLKAECFRMIQNDALAMESYKGFLRAYPSSSLAPHAMIFQARSLKGLGRIEEAQQLLTALKTRKQSKEIQVEALYLEAEIATMSADYKRATELMTTAYRMADANQPERYINIHALLTYYLLKAQNVKDAAATMRRLLQVMPRHPLGIVADILAGFEAHERKDLQTEISSYENALLKYDYSTLSDVAMAMMLSAYFDAGKYQELVTHANRVMNVVNAEYTAQNLKWRGHSYLLIGEAYYKLKLYFDASRFYEQALKEPTITQQARLYLAWSKFHEGKYTQALQLAQQILNWRHAPEEFRVSAHLLTASSHFNLNNYDAALEAFRNFRNLYPQDAHVPESWFYEGWAHRQSNDYGNALLTWKRLVERYPTSSFSQEAQLQIGRLYFQAHKFQDAINAFNKLITRWPQSPLTMEAQWQIAQTYFNARQDAAAIEAYKTFLARYPKDRRVPDAQNQMMLTLYRQAMRAKDRGLLTKFVQTYPKTTQAGEAQYTIAQMSFDHKNWKQAVEDFHKLLLDYPGHNQAPLSLLATARAEERLKNRESAITEYRSLLDLFPNHPAALDAAMRLGALYFSMEKYKEAAESFRFVMEREAPKEIQSSALYNLAVAYKKQHSNQDAVEAFSKFEQTYPDDPKKLDVLLEIASLYRQIELPEKSIITYRKILKMPNLTNDLKIDIYNRLGELYAYLGDKEKAVEAYNNLIPLSPPNHNTRLLGLAQLAAIYEQGESWTKALSVYKKIAVSGGKREWVQSAARRAKEIEAYIRARRAEAEAAPPPKTEAAPPPKAEAEAPTAPKAQPAPTTTPKTETQAPRRTDDNPFSKPGQNGPKIDSIE